MRPRPRSLALATTVASGVVLALAPTAGSAPTTETFEFTGAAEQWTVPADVCEITIDAYGAEGGDAGGGILAGRGARATATIEVTPGQVLLVLVGGAGAQETGGFNGGGDGQVGFNFGTSYGGGGASDVRTGPSLDERILVAGGGGGRSNGAGGGGDAGEVGVAGEGIGGGGGGTQSSGGTALGTAEPGSLGQGGAGGTDPGDSNVVGGGGGGGYYGGGGGTSNDQEFDGSGGGGGSSFGPAGTVFETGAWGNLPDSTSIDGQVEISYDPEAGTCPADDDPVTPPAAQPVATDPTYTG